MLIFQDLSVSLYSTDNNKKNNDNKPPCNKGGFFTPTAQPKINFFSYCNYSANLGKILQLVKLCSFR